MTWMSKMMEADVTFETTRLLPATVLNGHVFMKKSEAEKWGLCFIKEHPTLLTYKRVVFILITSCLFS